MKLGRAFVVDDAALIDCNVTETEAAWLVGTTYAANAVVRRTVDGVHRRFSSVAGGNLGNDPALLDAALWTDEGPTNRWAALDQRLQQQTTNADSVYFKIQVTGRIDTLYVGNISAETLRIKATDATAGVVHDETYGLISTSRITDWARWFREPVRPLTDKGVTDLPSGYADLLVEVWLTDTGATVALGELVMALMARIGGTKWGAGLGNRSYTSIGEDDFGTDYVTRRGRKRTGDFGVLVDNRDLDDVVALLDECDGRAVLYIGNDSYNATFIYGLLRGWQKVVETPRRSALTMNLQSFVR